MANGTNLFASQTSTLAINLVDENGLAVSAKCTGVPPTTANIFQHGCLINRTDSGVGVAAVYQNLGSSAAPSWTVLSTGGGGGPATSLVDANAVTAVDIGTTAAAVNYIRITDQAAGSGPSITAVGADANIVLNIAGKGTGALFLGQATSTGIQLVADQPILDSSGNSYISFSKAAVAVNQLTVGNAATGNSPTISATGTDANIPLTIVGKGSGSVNIRASNGLDTNVAGSLVLGPATATSIILGGTGVTAISTAGTVASTTTIGVAAGTGDITLGSSSATQSVLVANGAGAATVSIANVGTAGNTVNVATAAAAGANVTNLNSGATANGGSDTVNIATGVPVGTGSKTVHIADGNTAVGTGVNTVTIGSNSNLAHVTTIQGGSGATAIKLIPQTTGVVTIGATAGTGDVVVGSSSATQTVKIGDGAGVSTVNLANVSVAGANVNMATAVTGAGITDTVSISTGNAAATGVKVVNILTGTPGTAGNNRLTMGGTVADSRVTIKANFVSLRSANYIATEGGANNAITGSLTDAGGTNVPLVAGLRVVVKLAHTLQAGANTFDFNGGGALAIKSHLNIANDIATAYAVTGIIELMYDGALWVDMSQ